MAPARTSTGSTGGTRRCPCCGFSGATSRACEVCWTCVEPAPSLSGAEQPRTKELAVAVAVVLGAGVVVAAVRAG